MMNQMAPKDKVSGEYARPESQFRVKDFDDFQIKDVKKLYLFAGKTCPWAHRTLIVNELLKMRLVESTKEEDLKVEIIYLEPNKNTGLWTVPQEAIDRIFFRDGDTDKQQPMIETLRDVYSYVSGTKFEGRATAPLLISASNSNTFEIVCNESSDIIRLFDCCLRGDDENKENLLYPKENRKEIDEMCTYLFENVNNGVYKAGFAQSQSALDDAIDKLFDAFDVLDAKLAENSTFLLGDSLTLADICFYTTLVRFDAVYNHLFRCTRKRVCDYEHLSRYLRTLYAVEGFRETTDIARIREQYYTSLFPLNPGGIVPPLPFSSSEAWLSDL
jgi:putative glutathione S-transferase|tara:strand:+ start:2483 stop:3472 length:990 start_codon:yes stop_codon:yes gene_type:complete